MATSKIITDFEPVGETTEFVPVEEPITKVPQQESWGQVISEGFSNIPKSAYENVKPLVSPDTYVQLAKMANLVNPGGWQVLLAQGDNPIEMTANVASAMKDMVVERYGSIANLKNTIKTDPVGFLFDLSLVATGTGGLVTKVPKLAKVGAIVSKAGMATEPLNLARVPARGIRWLMGKTRLPEHLYESAVKFTKKIPMADRKTIVDAGLKEGIILTEDGLARTESAVKSLNKQIEDIITPAAKAGETIDSSSILKGLDDLYTNFYSNTPNPQPFKDAIDNAKQLFVAAHGNAIPIDEAQRMKQTIYALNKKAYGDLKGIQIEMNKTIARKIKDEIVLAHPEISKLNAKESALIKLEHEIERAVKGINNKDIVGLRDAVEATAGAAAGGVPGAVVTGIMGKLIDRPQIKARIGIALDASRRKKWFNPSITKTRLAIFETAKGLNEEVQIP